MFRATFKKYWHDMAQEKFTLNFGTFDEILEYVYKAYENRFYGGNIGSFICKGGSENGSGYCEAQFVYEAKSGYRGSLRLLSVDFITKGEGALTEIRVFEENRFSSPKAAVALDGFAKAAESRKTKYGDF